MTAKDRVMDAVSKAAREVIGRPEGEQITHLFEAFAEAMLTELGGDRVEAPPARELPTEPGDVVLVTGILNASGERPAIFGRGADGHLDWHYVDGDGDMCTRPPGSIDWVRARVVRDDERGPAAAFRRILAAVQRDDIGCIQKRQAVEFEAGLALKALGGDGS
jgi:hypothetical protein